MRASAARPAASRSVRWRRRNADGYCRACSASIAASALAMALMKASLPMKPLRGLRLRLRDQVFGAAEADFQPHVVERPSKTARADRPAQAWSDRARDAAAACRTARPAAASAHGPCAGRRRRAASGGCVYPSSSVVMRGLGPGIHVFLRCVPMKQTWMAGTSPAMTAIALLHRALDRRGEVGLFPGEAAILVGRAAEMAVGRGAPVDRAVELERAADVGRASAGTARAGSFPASSRRPCRCRAVSTRTDIGSATPIA